MGRILGPYGVKGWVKIQPYSEKVMALAAHPSWWLKQGEQWSAVNLDQCEPHGAHMVARIGGCQTREEAFALRGIEVAVDRAALPEPRSGEFYQTDLLGMTVRNRDGTELGQLAEIFENGAHDIMRVTGAGAERLLPFIPNVVDSIDAEAREIRVDWGADW